MAKAKRLVRREHLNFLHWRTNLWQYVPSAFSVSVRVEPLTVDSFTTLTLERMVRAESQKLADRASVLRAHDSESTLATGQTFFGLNFVRRSYAGVIVQALQELRMESKSIKKGGARQKSSSEGKLHVDIPAMEFFVAKKSNPPEIFVRAMGVEMKIPIGHETLYDLAALGLKRNMPHYK